MLALLFLMFDDDPLKLFKQESPHVCLRVYKKVQIMRCASNSIIQRKRKTQRTEWMVLPMKEKNTGIRKYFGKVRSSYSCCFLAKQTREPTPCPTKPLLHHFPPVVFVWPWGQHVICAHWEELGCMGKMGELNRAGLVWAFIFLSLLAFSFQEQKELTSGCSFNLFAQRTCKRLLICFHLWYLGTSPGSFFSGMFCITSNVHVW